MSDNFDLRQFMADNKVGPYIKSEAKITQNTQEGKGHGGETFDNKREWIQALFREHPYIKENPKAYMHEDENGNISVSKGLESFGRWYEGRQFSKVKYGVVYPARDSSNLVYPPGSRMDEIKLGEVIDIRKVQSADDRVRNLMSNISTNSNIPTEEKMGLLDALQELMDFIEDVGYEAEREEEDGPVSDYSRRRASELNENLSAEAIDRMDSLVNQRDMTMVLEKLNDIKDELSGEGFEEGEVLQYMYMAIGDYLGRP